MRLDLFLVSRNYCESRKEAQEAIENGNVSVDSVVVTKPAKSVSETSSIIFNKKRRFVSRGGEKLESVFIKKYTSHFLIKQIINGATAIDIGSSTGGFSDFLLQNGATHVDAVDIGTNQLHHSLRLEKRISLYENQDIRTFVSDKNYDIVVADLSFIPLEKVFIKILSLGKNGSLFGLLLKPQFEVGRGNTKKGIVRDPLLVETVFKKYKTLLSEVGITNVDILESGIRGGDGNQEYFLFFIK